MKPEEKERILNLVKQGLLTSEEATILLENRAIQENNVPSAKEGDNQNVANDIGAEPYANPAQEEVVTAFYEEMANQANQNATLRDQKYLVQKELEKELAEKLAMRRELTALNAAEIISPENEMKLMRLEEEIEQLSGQLELIKEEISTLDRLLKHEQQSHAQAEEPAVDTAADQSVREKLNDAVNVVGKTLSGLFTIDKTTHRIPMPRMVKSQYHKEYVFPHAKASVFNIKISRGNVNFNVWDRDDLVIACEGRIYGVFDEASPVEAFRNRSIVEVNDDDVNLLINNRFITSNIDIFAPRQTFDYIQLNALSGNVHITDLESNDIFIQTLDGDITLDKVKSSMIELDTKNGNITMQNIIAKDISAKTLNGNHRLTGEVKHTVLSSLNGSIRVTYLTKELVRATLASKTGDIKVNMPKNTSLHGRAQTGTGKILFRHDQLEVVDIKDEQFMQVKQFDYQNENEPFDLNLTTFTGNIRIKADADI